jgi:hypothetical protein
VFVRGSCSHAGTGGRPPGGLQLREGAKALPAVYASWPNNLSDLRAYAGQVCGEEQGLGVGIVAAHPGAAASVSMAEMGLGADSSASRGKALLLEQRKSDAPAADNAVAGSIAAAAAGGGESTALGVRAESVELHQSLVAAPVGVSNV